MVSIKINKSKTYKHIKKSIPLMERWLLCQKIGKLFYDSGISFERLLEIKDYFERSDFLKEEVFNPKLK